MRIIITNQWVFLRLDLQEILTFGCFGFFYEQESRHKDLASNLNERSLPILSCLDLVTIIFLPFYSFQQLCTWFRYLFIPKNLFFFSIFLFFSFPFLIDFFSFLPFFLDKYLTSFKIHDQPQKYLLVPLHIDTTLPPPGACQHFRLREKTKRVGLTRLSSSSSCNRCRLSFFLTLPSFRS